jgi:ribonucleoside-diphosphate reductase alpha chain
VAERFERRMSELEFLPNSPTLMNAGTPVGQLAACFVLPLDDSMESIYRTLHDSALIQKSGGGTGFSFSRLRPRGDRISTTKGVSSGPLSFIQLYDYSTEINRLGGARKGANMAVMRCDHPDILEFVRSKQRPHMLHNFNISVAVDDPFMRRVVKGQSYPLINPHTGRSAGQLKAAELFREICELAWRTGDPGLLFLDRINAANPTPQVGPIEATNPCGEQPLLPYEACNLGSINLARLTRAKELDWDQLAAVVDDAVRLLDNVIDASRYPLPATRAIAHANRKIGLGVMGFADLLLELGISYSSARAVRLGERIMRFISERGWAASTALARERGPFPNWKGSALWQRSRRAVRNATVTTVAPTGTLSLIANVSSGIEPLYAVSYFRTILGERRPVEVHPLFRKRLAALGLDSPELFEKVAATGSIQGFAKIPPGLRELFVTAHDISPEQHIRIQAAFQKHTDNGVSKTVNLRRDATVEDVRTAYLLAWKLGCKGVTVYRDRSKETQVLQSAETAASTQASAQICPECGGPIEHDSSCQHCLSCGWTVCST